MKGIHKKPVSFSVSYRILAFYLLGIQSTFKPFAISTVFLQNMHSSKNNSQFIPMLNKINKLTIIIDRKCD